MKRILYFILALLTLCTIPGLSSCSRTPKAKVISSTLSHGIYHKCVSLPLAEPKDSILATIITKEVIPFIRIEENLRYGGDLYEISCDDSSYYISGFDTTYIYDEDPDFGASYIKDSIRFLIHSDALHLFTLTDNQSDTIRYVFSEQYPEFSNYDPFEWLFLKTDSGYQVNEVINPYVD